MIMNGGGDTKSFVTSLNSSDKQWWYVMQTAAVSSEYTKYYNKVEKEAALDWMLKHPENNSSILSSITSARQNAKMVRHALTTDVWEAINGSFLDIQNLLKGKIRERDLSIILRTIKQNLSKKSVSVYSSISITSPQSPAMYSLIVSSYNQC